MASGFSFHAQFSEDSAWLRDWLQDNNRIQSSKDDTSEKTPVHQDDHSANGEGEDTGEGHGGDTGCRLFWSGESSSQSQASLAQSPGNLFHFHLHLSSYTSSSCRGSQTLDTSELLVQSLRKVEAASEPVEIDRLGQYDEMVKVSNPEEDAPQPVELDGARQCREGVKVPNLKGASPEPVKIDKAWQCEERLKVSELIEAAIDDAVELSITASEALIINELVESDSDLRYLPMTAVVEMALRVKQARLEGLEHPPHGTIGGKDEDCCPAELDDKSTPAGVSFRDHDDQGICDLDFSHVEETPVFKNHNNCENGSESLLGDIGNLSASNQSDGVLAQDRGLIKASSLEVTNNNVQNQDAISVGIPPGPCNLSTSNLADKIHLSVGSILNGSDVDERSGFAVIRWTLSQPRSDVSLSLRDHEHDGRRHSTAQFRSSWFGGRTTEEVAPTQLKQQYTNKSIAKPFVGETSFLSESAEVAVDENSVVQGRDLGRTDIASQSNIPLNSAVQGRDLGRTDIASQSNIPLGGSCEKRDQALLSQDVATSLTQSSVDPLCSIVPCSLSAEDPHPMQAECQDGADNQVEKCGSPISGPQLVKLSKASDPEIRCNHQKVHSPRADEECSRAAVRRRLSSLKNYSMPLPNVMTGLRNKQINSSLLALQECNRSTASAKIQRNANRPSGTGSIGLSSHKFKLKFPVTQLNEKNHGSGTSKPTSEKATNRNSKPISGMSQILPPLPTKRQLPLTFNCMKRRCIQVSRYLTDDSFSKDKHPVEPEAAVDIQSNNLFHVLLRQDRDSIVNQGQQEKKVRFAEDIMSQPVDRNSCSTIQILKSLRYCNQQFDPRNEGVHFLPRFSRARKYFIFQGIEFLVTGFSGHEEKEMEGLIQRHGGVILFEIPSFNFRRKERSKVQPKQPIVIASEKLKTTKFLYGCAVKSLILDVSWLTDSISAGSIKSPERYMIISYPTDATTFNNSGETFRLSNKKLIFEGVGIMLHGKSNFYSKFVTIIKHGGGQAFKTLQHLLDSLDNNRVSIGIIATEFESTMSRHLRHCAMERNVPVMPASWIVQSLYAGKLLPLPGENCTLPSSKV